MRNVVVTKFDSSGNVLYSTFIGGSVNDYGQSIAVDANGNAYIAGHTNSTDYPTTANAYQTAAAQGGTTAFLSKLSPDGSTLEYSSYFSPAAANGTSSASSILLDAKGHVYLAGDASPGLPTTPGVYKAQQATGNAAFVASFDLTQQATNQLASSTYYGTDTPQQNSVYTGNAAYAMAFDPSGNIWITGQSYTNNLPTTPKAIQATVGALTPNCAPGAVPLNSVEYLAELSPDLTKLVYATYLSGQTEAAVEASCSEYGYSLTFDLAGNLYVLGTTASDKFPVTAGTLQSTFPSQGGNSAYVSNLLKLSPDGSKIVWGTYLGGNTGGTYMKKVLADPSSNLWVGGLTKSTNYPITSNAYQTAQAGGYDATITQLSPDGTKTLYSTFIGGSGDDAILSFALDPASNIYLAGFTNSNNFPVTPTAFQSTLAPNKYDGYNWFFSILGSGTIGTIGPLVGGNTGDTSLTVDGAGFQHGATCSLVQGGTTIASAQATVNSGGTSVSCTFPLNGAATGSYDVV
ncbi:MAG: SBBP repeat-containing protein, partial [Acidobacteriaceae bacterium]